MMYKLFFSFVFVVVFCAAVPQVFAKECMSGDLRLEIADAGSQAPAAGYPAQVFVLMKTPTPGYIIKMDDGVMTTDQQLYFTMRIKNKKNKGEEPMMSAQVISDVMFEQDIKIPSVAKGVTFSVIKDYNWGPDFYKLDLPAQPHGKHIFCLKPQESLQ